ncbi:MAG: UbiH/UbiF/VisC/COQ6 family ubiquinone biosynthesis hydroxylase [Pseudomonadota bacterium]
MTNSFSHMAGGDAADQSADVVIVGGGLAGGLAALAFASEGFSSVLIDATAPARLTDTAFDGRTTAISYASARVFRRLGLWDDLAADAEPIRDILVTDGRLGGRGPFQRGAVSPLHLHFDSNELNEGAGDDQQEGGPLGWIVENRLMRQAIFKHVAQKEMISLIAPARQVGAERSAAGARVTLDDGRIIEGALLVAADGRYSPLRADAGLKVNHWRYKQTGIVATILHEKSHEGIAQELFLPSGPFAILPLTSLPEDAGPLRHRSSLVWTEHEDAAPAYLALNDTAFTDEIAHRTGPYLGEIALEGPRWSYPLAFHLAQSFIAPRLALIGDAAHAVHPIAGQGYNLGVKDIAALTDVLADAHAVGLDIGALTTLQHYQRWRRFDSASLALGMDMMNRLFSNDAAPLRFVRDIGMGAVGKVQPLRKFFMRQAGADLGALPRLMAREG